MGIRVYEGALHYVVQTETVRGWYQICENATTRIVAAEPSLPRAIERVRWIENPGSETSEHIARLIEIARSHMEKDSPEHYKPSEWTKQ